LKNQAIARFRPDEEVTMLHPQARALLDLMIERGVPPTESLSHLEARAAYRDRRALLQPLPQRVADVKELLADGPHGAIPMRLYRPQAAADMTTPSPVLVYFHGGGWVIGDLDTHDTLCRELANRSGIVVVAVDYRLSPEHRFPAAYDDALAAARWIHDHAAELDIDAGRLAVGGDSAGGNLAAAVALGARDARDARDATDRLPIAFQLLIYPATDMRRGHASHVGNGKGYLLTSETIDWFHDHYIDDARHDLDWRASPLLHAGHANLPPALIITAGYDPLRDEGLDYARVLSAAGNHVSYVSFDREIHGFITMGKVLDEANTAVALCAAELRRVLFL
jgi:acetyl esterase